MQIVLISGKQGSGKTTLQNGLVDAWTNRYKKTAVYVNFADILYEMHNAVIGILNNYWPDRGLVKDGPLMQLLGTDWGRKIDQDIWVKCAQHRIAKDLSHNDLVMIGDCRFENEFDGFSDALRVRLECPEEIRKQRCSMWRDNTTHLSETNLDDYSSLGKFDITLDTSKTSINGCLELVLAQLSKQSWMEKRGKAPTLTESAQGRFSELAKDFNDELRWVENDRGFMANFQWAYDATGKKYLKVSDVAPVTKPSEETIAKAKTEVPDIMQMAESLVGTPVEIKPNDQPAGS